MTANSNSLTLNQTLASLGLRCVISSSGNRSIWKGEELLLNRSSSMSGRLTANCVWKWLEETGRIPGLSQFPQVS